MPVFDACGSVSVFWGPIVLCCSLRQCRLCHGLGAVSLGATTVEEAEQKWCCGEEEIELQSQDHLDGRRAALEWERAFRSSPRGSACHEIAQAVKV